MRSLLTSTILLLSLFQTSISAQDIAAPPVSGTGPTDPICLNYARIANFSAIGSNSTLRSAFLQASPQGTLQNKMMLDAAVAALPPLTINQVLNDQCGNLTTVAIAEAATNFSMGVVGPFTKGVLKNPQAIVAGPLILGFVVLATGILVACTWVP